MSTDILDITPWKQKGWELKVEIENAVASTQSIIIQPLPNILIMTKAQYDDLQHDPEMIGAYQSTQHLYLTPHNVMDVVIKD